MKHKPRNSLKHSKQSKQWKNKPRAFTVMSHAGFGEDNISFSLTCKNLEQI